MSRPFIPGELVYKALWPRVGTNPRIIGGKVALADGVHFYVTYGEGSGENLLQAHPDGWCRTQDEALALLLDRLGRAKDFLNNDVLRVKARILRVTKLRGQLAEMGA